MAKRIRSRPANLLDALPPELHAVENPELHAEGSPERCLCPYCARDLSDAERDATERRITAWKRARGGWLKANGYSQLELLIAELHARHGQVDDGP